MDALYPYQQQGAQWLASRRFALLADDPGLGKSAQAITAADAINAQRILVICPASVRINWTREFEKFSMLGGGSTALLDGASHTRLPTASRIVTVSYNLATRTDVNSSLRSWMAAPHPATLLVLDEVHFLKSTTAQRSHAILGRDGLVHCAARTWALSGTPAPNHLDEVWPLLRVFGVYRNSYEHFVEQFCVTAHSPYGRRVVGNKADAIPSFRALIAPVILRRKVQDVMPDLPEIRFGEVTVPAGPVDYELAVPDYYLTKRLPVLHDLMGKQRDAVQAIVNLTGMGHAGIDATGAVWENAAQLRRHVGLQKVQGVIDLVSDELNSGLDKIVIFAIHQAVIEGLRVGLAKFGAVTLYGGTPPEKRQRNVDKFAKDSKCRVFIGNIQAAGVGVDGLQRQCCNVLFVEKYGVPGTMAQAIMRVRRNGQTRPVLVRSVRLEDDELFTRVERALFRKAKDLVAAFD